MVQPDYQLLVDNLKSAVGLLDIDRYQSLRQDVLTVCDRLMQRSFRIVVFGPFNYGKSTLLNAMLGEKTLPIDLIPTTGAAICVKYGETLHTYIRSIDGTEISEPGTDILKRFAILNEHRCMREDVASVEVHCPHPFLKRGVELLDLPGTNDREAQDSLVRNQLLTADLVIQVLDGRKLMTLGEREHLRDWLLDRGITNVIFVVNFLNLLEPDDRKEVYNRMRFVAESFRAKLPPNVSNLYRVDALPALRARLKGNVADAQTSGLPTLESGLESIIRGQQEEILDLRSQRVQLLVQQVQQALQSKIEEIRAEVTTSQEKQKQRLQIQQKAQRLIQQGFNSSIATLQEWLALPQFVDRYEWEATNAWQQGTLKAWEATALKPAWTEKCRTVTEWVDKACEFFNCSRPADLEMEFPEIPDRMPPNPASPPAKSSSSDVPVAIATGVGWMLGGPVGAAVLGGASYLLKRNEHSSATESSSENTLDLANDVIRAYLSNFSTTALLALDRYEIGARLAIDYPLIADTSVDKRSQHQLQLLETILANLHQNSAYI